MLRNICLAGVDKFNDFADIHLTVVEEEPDDRQPRHVTEHSESIRDMLEQLDWEVPWHIEHSTTIE